LKTETYTTSLGEPNEVSEPTSTGSKGPSSSSTSTSKSNKPLSTTTTKKDVKQRPFKPMETFDEIGHVSSDIISELQHSGEGFDLNIAQQICDDNKPNQMEDSGSYFVMRHMLNYPGPWTALMTGPDCYGYRVSAEAVKKDKCVLVGTYGQNAVEGMWEQTWSSNNKRLIKSNVNFVAGFKSAQQQQMEMMMGGGTRYPSMVGQLDCRFLKQAWRFKMDMMNNELSASTSRKVTKQLVLGAKIGTSYDSRKSWLEFAGRYEFGATKVQARPFQHSLEAIWRNDSSLLQLSYTNNISNNLALTSRLLWQVGTTDKVQSAIGYKFQFGKMLGAGKSIVGEIASDGRVCQSITMPLLPTMVLRCYGELNHWTTPELMQRGMVPHKFGVQLNIHI